MTLATWDDALRLVNDSIILHANLDRILPLMHSLVLQIFEPIQSLSMKIRP